MKKLALFAFIALSFQSAVYASNSPLNLYQTGQELSCTKAEGGEVIVKVRINSAPMVHLYPGNYLVSIASSPRPVHVGMMRTSDVSLENAKKESFRIADTNEEGLLRATLSVAGADDLALLCK